MPTQPMDRQTFLTTLRESGLLADDHFRAWVKRLPDGERRGKALARSLVEQGLLTKFQAERLLAGVTHGFVMGQYVILEELGRGGMGRVYKARHVTMDRIVALKVLSAELTRTEKARHMFEREVKAAAKLVHPNIVTAFDANRLDDRLFLVMEYVDGPNLQDLARARGPLSVAQVCDFIRQSAVGLQYAHDLGMVHRDIKPSNLLAQTVTGPDGRPQFQVKILDFGLARVGAPEAGASLDVAHNQVMGTPDFLSPEQARNVHAVDHRSDLYSLGCTFYYLLTGRVPYPGGNALEKLVRHGVEEPEPVERLRPDVLLPVAEAVRRLMAKRPDDRYATATEAANALEPYTAVELAPAWADDFGPATAVQPTPPPTSGPAVQLETPLNPLGSGHIWTDLHDAPAAAAVPLGSGTTSLPTLRRPIVAPRPASDGGWLWILVGGLIALLGGGAIGWLVLNRAG